MRRAQLATVARFWAVAWAGNLAGALIVGYAVHLAQHYPTDVTDLLGQVVARNMAYRSIGGAGSRWQIVLSGVLANLLVCAGARPAPHPRR